MLCIKLVLFLISMVVVMGVMPSTSIASDANIIHASNVCELQSKILEQYGNIYSEVSFELDNYSASEYKDMIENLKKSMYDDQNNYYIYYRGMDVKNDLFKNGTEYGLKGSISFKYMDGINKNVDMQLQNMIDDALNGMNINSLSNEDKIMAIHDYIINKTRYNFGDANHLSKGFEVSSPEAIMLGDGGNCEAYSKLFQMMAKRAGLKSRYIVGDTNKGKHAWDMVKLDEKWYHIDVTFDDPLVDGKDAILHKYYLKTDEQFKAMGYSWNAYPVNDLGIKMGEEYPIAI